jgi:hyperosmotically inducible protein
MISTLAVDLLFIGAIANASAAAASHRPRVDRVQSDAEVRGRVEAALAKNWAVEAWDFDVRVEGGVVTLHGQVDSQAEKRLAVDVAKDILGVRYVRDRLHVMRPRYQRPDFEVEAEINGLFRTDPRIEATMIDVTVKQGNVRLTGSVGSRQKKRIAQSVAHSVSGVRSVRSDTLKVRKWLYYDTDAWYPSPTDRQLEAIIRSAITSHPQVQVRQFVVDVDGDVATLSGVVRSLSAKRLAGREARATSDIRVVRNHLEVQPGRRSDAKILSDILHALEKDPQVDRRGVSVSVYDQKAYLGGEVASRAVKRRVERVAAQVNGLIEITNTLVVRKTKSM